ncbi:hypothetical protein CerSpe_207050 [Prunus speciosa]
MNKAYDRVEWDFLEAVMKKMGFDDRWVNLVMGCVKFVTFAVMINGQPGRRFHPSRGIRQGDPISPYLFLFVSEVLSLMISKAINSNVLQGIKLGSDGPIVSHLLFVDDTLVFMKATKPNCDQMVQLLNVFCEASGQQINYSKSCLFFTPNIPDCMRREIEDTLNIREIDDPGKYLGLPTLWGRAKKDALAYIKDRINKKVQNWKQALLSQAGKEILLKAVVQAIPAYPMNIFRFPTFLCNELNSIMANFWWGQAGNERKIHWINWESMCRPKLEVGLGFRNFQEFNMALLAKQVWGLILEPNAWWVKVIRGRYFPDSNFLEARRGCRASWAWSSLLEARDVIITGAVWA